MPNSTVEYWDVDGVSLQTLTQNLKSWGGSREGVPPLRGEDQKIPFMRGSRFVRKVPDSRTITLTGWLLGQEAFDTVIRQNRFTNSLPTSSNAGYTNSTGTGGVTTQTRMNDASTPNGFPAMPYMRTTWTTGGAGASAGVIVTSYVSGNLGDLASTSIWVRTSNSQNITVLLRFRNNNTVVGQLTPAYVQTVAGGWQEWRLEGLVSTDVYTSMQMYVLVNNSDSIATGAYIDVFAPTFEIGVAKSGGALVMGMSPTTDTNEIKLDGSNFPTWVFKNFRTSVQAAKNNWRALRKLLWTPRRQVSLTRRWYDENGVLQTATALAQYSGGMEPDVGAGGSRMEFSVDLFLADPFFYGAEVTETLTRTTQTKTILGDWSSVKSRIELAGSQGPTTLTVNGAYAHGVTYGTTVASGATAILDIENFTAKDGANGKTGSVSHSGHKYWFEPDPGPQSITVSGTGTGTVKYIYQPAWL